jgi:hypothetical protein
VSTRAVVGLVVGVLVFLTIAGLYATGPSRYPDHCNNIPGGACFPGPRTNAYERIKGAITGNP